MPAYWLVRFVGAGLMTFAIFLVLPLTQMVSHYAKGDLLARPAELAVLEAPPSPEEAPPPPVQEQNQDEPPQPEIADEAPPVLLNIDLDFAVGTGGALAAGWLGGEPEEMDQGIAQALDVAELDRAPALMTAVPPRYPPELRRAKIEGAVTVVFVLNEEGRVEDPRVESSTRPEFEQPAMEALKRWRFAPGMKEGAAVRTYLRQPIRFRVTG